jgi:FlaA1/EpsC-like NDP-sugar epimerase
MLAQRTQRSCAEVRYLRSNVFGTLTVARAAHEAGVETCVLISTDKAVRPPM